MRISDWSSDVCSSDLVSKEDSSASAFTSYIHFSSAKCVSLHPRHAPAPAAASERSPARFPEARRRKGRGRTAAGRSEEHTSELQSLMRISYAVFCLKKKTHEKTTH